MGNGRDKELDSLKQHQAFDKVPIKTALPNKKVIGSRFMFKQKTAGLYKLRLVTRVYKLEPGRDYGATLLRN